VNDTGPALSRLDLSGTSHLSLHRSCLVMRSDFEFEAMPLSAISAVRVAYERDSGRIGWGASLVIAALLLFVIASPIGGLAGNAAREMAGAGAQGVGRALEVFFRIVEAIAAALPYIALAVAIGGALLVATGWRGYTVLTLSLAGAERVYSTKGHDRQMMEFGELVAEHLARLEKSAEK
jgi:hypothetical protein